ncbi:hypothetical protein KUV85_13890 [Nocardioides panacisoli]|uniref:hypothetical protein n=1 Tax=Nocardioides panacisoli TaxID=627624 RepID=UPI001C633D07|nr:hypothetical protein [Nocardioides panacisoli]QYJ03411.1 hypothetical protein KUV85_13890 [Nocardioides panacisoli]
MNQSTAVTLWRLLVAACAFTGVALAAQQYAVWWTALSQLASLAVGIAYLGLAVAEPRSPWLRGALASTMLLVALAFIPMNNDNLWDPFSVFEHMLTPALVVLDFVLVGANQARVRWWHPVTWLVPSAAYLAWYVLGGLDTYHLLDVDRPAALAANATVLAALLLAVGLVLYDVGRRRRPVPVPADLEPAREPVLTG